MVRLRDHADKSAWQEFYAVYGPMVYRYARKRGLSDADAEDVRSHAFQTVTEHIAGFDYQKERGGFRAWLRRIVLNRTIDHFRRKKPGHADTARLENLTAPDSLDEIWEREWQHSLLLRAMEAVRERVPNRNYQIFQLLVFAEKPPADVATMFATTTNQIYKAKSEVLRSIQELRTVLDSSFAG